MASRDDIASAFLDQLEHDPYPAQEEALLSWFSESDGVLVSAPTGTGKTLVAEAALFEALHRGTRAYYTTPLIALTDQKFREIQDAAVRWGFQPTDVGLVTGNRSVNPDARVLIVVAEILLNRLLVSETFRFDEVSAVVMDEFHSFNDPERGIVWELSLALLPKSVRLMLLSATVGNASDFLAWLRRAHARRLDLVQSHERKVPLRYHWVGEELLNDQISEMASGPEDACKTPMLLFCFNREECWRVAEQLKGKALLQEGQQKRLAEALGRYDWSTGAGPKLRTILMRGVGVHHAGVLPRYKRIVEDLFQEKLLSVCVCTETLSAGMNLPARSVLLSALFSGPPGRMKLLLPSSAQQMFGRAGRPQFDTEGHVFAIAHEDDVRIAKYKQKVEQIPEDTRDPQLIRKRKQLLKKMPKRRPGRQYWDESHFTRLVEASPGKLRSRGQIPWRLLAHMLSVSPDVSLVRETISRRLMDSAEIDASLRGLVRMLLTLQGGGFVTLEPPPTAEQRAVLVPTHSDDAATVRTGPDELIALLAQRAEAGDFTEEPVTSPAVVSESSAVPEAFGEGVVESQADPVSVPNALTGSGTVTDMAADTGSSSAPEGDAATDAAASPRSQEATPAVEPVQRPTLLSRQLKAVLEAQGVCVDGTGEKTAAVRLIGDLAPRPVVVADYVPKRAFQTERLGDLLGFKSVNPIYGSFLTRVLPYASASERLQVLESVLEFPRSLARHFRVPRSDVLPPGLFTREFLNPWLLSRGLCSPTELGDLPDDWDQLPPEEREWPLSFSDRILRLFQSVFPGVEHIRTTSVWVAGDLLAYGGDFNKLVTSRKVARQEGIVFRHVLRLILLCAEFSKLLPQRSVWRMELDEIGDQLTDACRAVDPKTTERTIESAEDA